jgi:hypothetical protein
MRFSGHVAQFSAIDFNAAFVGFQDAWMPRCVCVLMFLGETFDCGWHQAVRAPINRATVLTLMATFGSNILAVFLSPVLSHAVTPVKLPLHRVTLLFVLLQTLVLTVSCVFTAVQRRHLMTWSIFAPKLTFELVATLVVCFVSLVSPLLYARASPRVS